MLKTKTIADTIYEELKRSILDMDFMPGSKLSEAQTAKKFQVSRAPVRDAIQRLQQENLVLVRPQVGTIVSPIASYEKAMEICEVRLLLEPYIARKAACNFSGEEKEVLSRLFEKLQAALPGTPEHDALLFETDLMLHSALWEKAGNSEMETILTGYKREIKRIQFTNMKLTKRSSESANEMRVIFDAILENNPSKCEEAMRRHVTNLAKALQEALGNSEV